MKNSKSEFLSAFLDDEADTFERRRLMDELKQDDALAAQLSRYAFIGEALRANQKAALAAPKHFLEGVNAKISEDEQAEVIALRDNQTASVPLKRPKRPWLQYSIAAGFGAITMAIVLTQVPSVTKTASVSAEEAMEVAAVNPVVEDEAILLPPPRPINRLDPKTQAVLKEYIAEHIRYASTTTVVPTIRAVSYNQ